MVCTIDVLIVPLRANLLSGFGTGINGANSNAATNTTGFAPPKGAEYAQSEYF
jgi:hypothetical protein